MQRPANNIDHNYNSGDQSFKDKYEGHENYRFQSTSNDNGGSRGSCSVIKESGSGRQMVVESGEYDKHGNFRGSRQIYDL